MSVISTQKPYYPYYPYYNKTKLKEGYIWLNGYKIKIGNSLKETARNINKLFIKTGVKASVVKNNKGEERLVLKVRGERLDIDDPKGILAELYKKGKIAKNKDCIIQVIKLLGSSGNIKINYNLEKIEKQYDFSDLKKDLLSAHNIIFLSNNLVINRLEVEDYSDSSTEMFSLDDVESEYSFYSCSANISDDDVESEYS